MRLLLDSHVLIWIASDPRRLPDQLAETLADSTNELYVSAVTAFEIATKHRIGKLPDAARLVARFADAVTEIRASHLPVDSRHGIAAGQLDWEHRDPLDRILAAQSIVEGIPLVSADPVFSGAPGLQTLWA